MDRVGREQHPQWPKADRTCPMCKQGVVEDVNHFISECPSCLTHRKRLHKQVTRALAGNKGPDDVAFKQMAPLAQTHLLLGQRIGDPKREDRIDKYIRKYLTKAWNARHEMTVKINKVLGKSYDIMAPPVEDYDNL